MFNQKAGRERRVGSQKIRRDDVSGGKKGRICWFIIVMMTMSNITQDDEDLGRESSTLSKLTSQPK